MSYICYATKEPVPAGTPMVLVPLVKRKVNYNNYEVTLKGNRLFKQYTGTTTGYETAVEVPVTPSLVESFVESNPTQYLPEPKNVTSEFFPRKIKPEIKEKLEASDQVTVNDKLPSPVSEDSYKSFNELARYYNHFDEDED